jgi:hypothetical protein
MKGVEDVKVGMQEIGYVFLMILSFLPLFFKDIDWLMFYFLGPV